MIVQSVTLAILNEFLILLSLPSLPTPKKSHKSSLPQTYHHCIVMESYEDYPPSFIFLYLIY